jgi:hypothetical protein
MGGVDIGYRNGNGISEMDGFGYRDVGSNIEYLILSVERRASSVKDCMGLN